MAMARSWIVATLGMVRGRGLLWIVGGEWVRWMGLQDVVEPWLLLILVWLLRVRFHGMNNVEGHGRSRTLSWNRQGGMAGP